MIPVDRFAGRRVAVFGLARSRHGLRPSACGSAAPRSSPGTIPRAARGKARRTRHSARRSCRRRLVARIAALVLRPGMPCTHPEPHWTVEQGARRRHRDHRRHRAVPARAHAAAAPSSSAITGTNGKSTTTALIGHLLQVGRHATSSSAAISARRCSLLAAAPSATASTCSSCRPSRSISRRASRPTPAVLLNITPDHLDRHGDMESYVAVKARMFASQRGATPRSSASTTNWPRHRR